MNLSFDHSTHSYLADGRKLPSVTGILRATGIYGSYEFAESHHKYRGQAVHHGAAILDAGGVPQLGPVPPYLQQVADDIVNGYWPAFSRWRDRTKFRGYIWECPLISTASGYGGTFDAAGMMGDSPEIVLVDLKSGVLPEMVPVQLAGYLDLITKGEPVDAEHSGWQWLQESARNGVPIRRVAVRLEKSGKDTMASQTSDGTSYDSPMWSLAWRSAVNLYNLRARFKLLEEKV